MAAVLFVAAVAAVNCLLIAALMRRRARSPGHRLLDGEGSSGVLDLHRDRRLSFLLAALGELTVQVLLALACALGVASLIFAVWAVPHAGTQPPALALALSDGLFPLFGISLIANTVITAREIPKDQRDPLSINAALYRRFARRSSRRVKAILATVLALAVPLEATSVVTEAPTGLFGGVILAFYVTTVAMLIALLPEPNLGGGDTRAP
jgi:hypothetical protein